MTDIETTEIEQHTSLIFTRGVSARGERRCPECGSIIYSRRHRLCGVCASPLPAACLFSEAEAHSVELLLNEERQRHRQWLRRFDHSAS